MEPLLTEIEIRLKESLKKGDDCSVQTLRLLKASIKNAEIEKRTKNGETALTEDEVQGVIKKEVKKRKEAIEIYKNAARGELAEKETAELKILEGYLPEGASEAEMEAVVKQVIDELKPTSAKDFGKVMGATMKILKGNADAGTLAEKIKTRLTD